MPIFSPNDSNYSQLLYYKIATSHIIFKKKKKLTEIMIKNYCPINFIKYLTNYNSTILRDYKFFAIFLMLSHQKLQSLSSEIVTLIGKYKIMKTFNCPPSSEAIVKFGKTQDITEFLEENPGYKDVIIELTRIAIK